MKFKTSPLYFNITCDELVERVTALESYNKRSGKNRFMAAYLGPTPVEKYGLFTDGFLPWAKLIQDRDEMQYVLPFPLIVGHADEVWCTKTYDVRKPAIILFRPFEHDDRHLSFPKNYAEAQ